MNSAKVYGRKQIKRFISSILDSVFVLIYFATRPPEGFILSFEAFEGVGKIPYPEKVKKKVHSFTLYTYRVSVCKRGKSVMKRLYFKRR